MIKYSQVETKEVKCCGLCKRIISQCQECDEEFKKGDEIICEVRFHIHKKCQ